MHPVLRNTRRRFLIGSGIFTTGVLFGIVLKKDGSSEEIDSLKLNFNINNLTLNNLELACALLEGEMVKRELLEIDEKQKDNKVISFYVDFIYKAIKENSLPPKALNDLMPEGKIRRISLVQFKLTIQRMLIPLNQEIVPLTPRPPILL